MSGWFRNFPPRVTVAHPGNPVVDDFAWPTQSAGYQTALPRHSGYGMDSYGGSGRDGAEGRVVVYFIDDFTNGSSVDAAYPGYTRMRHGNMEGYAAYKAANPSTPMIVVPIAAGTVNKRDDIRLGSYTDYYGQFAPGDGVIFKETPLSTIISFAPSNASHVRVWHPDLRAGDANGGIPSGARDSAEGGGSANDGSGGGGQVVWINPFFGWAPDELFGAYYGLGNGLCTVLYAVFGEPLHRSLHDDTGTPDDGVGVDSHGYGPIFGQGYRWDRLCISRCLFAHAATRNPEVAGLRFAGANNLIYNSGDPDSSDGFGLLLTVDYDAATPTTAAMLTNWTDNYYMLGPDSTATLNPVFHHPSTVQPTGSQGFLAGNVVDGATFASQSALVTGSPPTGWIQSSLLTTAWPAGWGSSREGVYRITTSSSPNGATSIEKTDFINLLCESVGPRPGFISSKNRARVIANHVIARNTGSGDEGSVVNSVDGVSNPASWPAGVASGTRYSPNAGDWPSLGASTVDPMAPGSEWYSAIPLNGTAPDDRVQLSGTFSNGLSKVGYTAIEVWAIEQHWYVGGK